LTREGEKFNFKKRRRRFRPKAAGFALGGDVKRRGAHGRDGSLCMQPPRAGTGLKPAEFFSRRPQTVCNASLSLTSCGRIKMIPTGTDSPMQTLFCVRETGPGEPRVGLTPDSARRIRDLGMECRIETGAGAASGFPDSAYEGFATVTDRDASLGSADIVISVNALPDSGIANLKHGTVAISFLDPFRNPQKVETFAAAGVCAVSLELIPRTTLAQKMDALSSQASLAGYSAVLLAAMRLDKILPMMMTPAGTLQPSRFLVIGVGVAGLQAIATAKRLGARVTAFDTRPDVGEQVKSLGAKFLKIDLGETGQTAQGYAKELTPEQLDLQRQGMARACAEADAVITTAQVFGRPAPRILTAGMVAGMRPGSVIVDMAVSTGGNVEGSEPDKETVVGGVRILGAGNLAATVPHHASMAFANNIASFLAHFSKDGEVNLNPSDEIALGAVVTRAGQIVHPRLQPKTQ
jgi:H+-translocating NAD(P) transhydrogenase subunit alpha